MCDASLMLFSSQNSARSKSQESMQVVSMTIIFNILYRKRQKSDVNKNVDKKRSCRNDLNCVFVGYVAMEADGGF